jgi:hypothetical protein
MEHQQFKDRLVFGFKVLHQIPHQRVTVAQAKGQVLQLLLQQQHSLQQLLLQQPHPLLLRQQQQVTNHLDSSNNKFEILGFLSLPMSSKIWNEFSRTSGLI